MANGIHSAVITGGTGFIGSHLAKRLCDAGTDVTLLLRETSNAGQLEALGIADQTKLVRSNLSTANIAHVLSEEKPSVVFHLASRFVGQHVSDDVDDLVNSNIALGARVLEAMTAADVRNIVTAGTTWQHYRQTDYCPVNLYAATKQAFVALAEYYSEACGTRVLHLELPDTYGPFDPRKKLLHLLTNAAMNDTLLAMSPGDQKIDLVHVDDVTAAFSLAGTSLVDTPGETCGMNLSYAVTSGTTISLRELVRVMEEVVGHALPVTFGARDYKPREVMDARTNTPCLPDWQARVPLREGLASLGIGAS